MALSVGTEEHLSFSKHKFKKLSIEDIYRLATIVVFPSLTEGRGLPIIESSAAGIPIICSRYNPKEVFAYVVGEGMSKNKQIRYIPFPEKKFSNPFLNKLSDLLLNPEVWEQNKKHNIEVIRKRYSNKIMKDNFKVYLATLQNLK